ncbi:hypothetical protein FB458_3056 [Lapillicoccus jejuensis]|uniref:Uncharacterized protein n=1 Tax=Lapillicoccus jejuensis TaxID=402171 RepID=A0A542E3M4_9MICO|nr:hypothetical protein FB458_3056 [Lapillicoccus jejuensis]
MTPGVSLSAVVPPAASRCGIYVLHFHEGSVYVGQTRNLLGRFSSHVRHWGETGLDIVELDFAPAPPDQLDDLEVRTLQWFETRGHRLLNVALVGLPAGDNSLDLVVDRVAQERWLVGGEGEVDLTERVDLAASRPQDEARFLSLSARDDYPVIRLALFSYVVQVLPLPQDTERRFWVMTALPSTKRSASQRRLVTVSVNNVETLVLVEIREEDGTWSIGGFLNTAPGDALVEGHMRRRQRYRTVTAVDAVYFVGLEGLFSLLQDPQVVAAARRLAVGLMRKGTGMLGRFHDQSLADDVFLVSTDL